MSIGEDDIPRQGDGFDLDRQDLAALRARVAELEADQAVYVAQRDEARRAHARAEGRVAELEATWVRDEQLYQQTRSQAEAERDAARADVERLRARLAVCDPQEVEAFNAGFDAARTGQPRPDDESGQMGWLCGMDALTRIDALRAQRDELAAALEEVDEKVRRALDGILLGAWNPSAVAILLRSTDDCARAALARARVETEVVKEKSDG